MNDAPDPPPEHPSSVPPPVSPAVPESRVDRRKRFSLIWAIPIVSALIGGWLFWDNYRKRGPTITITFQTAEGLQAGQSHVRHKDVDMGLITGVALTPDLSRVQVTVQMKAEAAPLLTDRAQFWVVKPRFFAGSVSGLETLVSGAYVELLPSASGGERKYSFEGLENPPVMQADVPGRAFLLKADRIGSLSLGSPIFFRDLDAGEVLGWDVDELAQNVTVHAYVHAPFDRYVHQGTRFWNASGLTVKFGSDGVRLQLESLKAVALGGIAFDTPPEAQNSPLSPENGSFKLYANRDDADSASFTQRVPFVTYFESSVQGLSVGAPVNIHGIKVGEVTGVQLQYDAKKDAVFVAVHFVAEPERIARMQFDPERGMEMALEDRIAHGLRAKLGSGSLITGQMLIDLAMVPDAPPAHMAKEGDTIVIPSAPGGLQDIARAATDVLAKIDSIPFDQIGRNLNETVEGLNQVANGPELRQALSSLESTLATVQDTVKRVDSGLSPALRQLPAIATGLQDTVTRANKLLGSVDASYGNNSSFNRNIDRLMAQLNDAAQSVRVLADLLTRHPEALVRGRTNQGLQ